MEQLTYMISKNDFFDLFNSLVPKHIEQKVNMTIVDRKDNTRSAKKGHGKVMLTGDKNISVTFGNKTYDINYASDFKCRLLNLTRLKIFALYWLEKEIQITIIT